MPDLERCPTCGKESVVDTGGEWVQVTEDEPGDPQPVKVCTECGWSNALA